jgi:hypothetical protein
LTSTMALALLGMPLVIMIHQEMRSNGGRSPIPTITAAMNSAWKLMTDINTFTYECSCYLAQISKWKINSLGSTQLDR